MRKWLSGFSGVMTLVILSGCMNVDYVGQRFPASVGSPADVRFYPSQADVPVDMRPIGRGEVIAPSAYTPEDLETLLQEKAFEVGADAVAMVGFRKVLVNVTTQQVSLPETPTGNWTMLGTSMDGSQIYTDSFGKQQGLEVVRTEQYRVELKALFLVTPERFKQVYSTLATEQQKQLEAELQEREAPAPADLVAREKIKAAETGSKE